MTRPSWFLLCTIPGLLCMGCGNATPGGAEAIRDGIVGGEPDHGHPAVGALLMDNGLCTGTLIAPNVVLTAAHCLEDGFPKVFVQGIDASAPGEILAVSDARVHPDYAIQVEQGAEVAWHDVGVVRLAGPSSAPPMALAPDDALRPGLAVTFVGYGRTHPETAAFGRKYRLTTNVALLWNEGFWNLTDPKQPHNTCHGDSGGPALVGADGVEKVVGVVSSGDANCIQTGYNIRLDRNRAFIEAALADWGKLAPAAPPDVTAPAASLWQSCDEPGFACPDGLVCVGSADGRHCSVTCPDPDGGLGCPNGFACVGLEPQASEGVCIPVTAACGDGWCGPGETPQNCHIDCKDVCKGVSYAGCCDGETLFWCEDGALMHLSCKANAHCAWNGELGYYDCGMPLGLAPGAQTSACPAL